MNTQPAADLVLFNGRIATQDERRSMVQALAIKDGRVLATGTDAEMLSGSQGKKIDLRRPHGHPRPDRLALAPDPRRPVLQPRAALGRRAVARRRAAHAARAGAAHAAEPLGARGRRLVGVPVRREAHADARGAQRRGAGHAGVRAASLRDARCSTAPRCARSATTQGHAESARRRDPARRRRQSDRPADRAGRTRSSSTRRSPRGRSCRTSSSSTRRASSCAS